MLVTSGAFKGVGVDLDLDILTITFGSPVYSVGHLRSISDPFYIDAFMRYVKDAADTTISLKIDISPKLLNDIRRINYE